MSKASGTVGSIRFDANAASSPDAPTTTIEWYASGNGAFRTGFWSSQPVRRDVNYVMDEICFILEGKVELTDASGHAEIYVAGDTFVIPAGFKGVWETVEPTRKFFAIHKAAGNPQSQ